MQLRPQVLILCGWLVLPVAGIDLKGRVIEFRTGLPVEDAHITVHGLAGGCGATKGETDDKGEFHLKVASPGRCRVEISRIGYGTSVWILPLDSEASLLVRMHKSIVISGRVTTEAGIPVSRASVVLMGSSPGSSALRRLRSGNGEFISTATDEGGHYRLFGLAPGRYCVVVICPAGKRAPGGGGSVLSVSSAPQFVTISEEEEYPNIDFTLSTGNGHSLEGRVYAPSNDAAVAVSLASRNVPAIPVARVATTSDGRFHLDGIPSGSYTLFAAGPTGGTSGLGVLLDRSPFFGRAEVDVTGENPQEISIQTRSGRQASFLLAGRDKTPVSACSGSGIVELTALEGLGTMLDRRTQATRTEPVVLQGLAPVKYAITVSDLPAGCYDPGGRIVDLAADMPPVTHLSLELGSSLRGKVIVQGEGDTRSQVILLWPATEEMRGQSMEKVTILTDANGRFDSGFMPPGRYRILAVSKEYWIDPQWQPDLTAASELELFPGATTNAEIPVRLRGIAAQ